MTQDILISCRELRKAYSEWKLWNMKMPEDAHPDFALMTREQRLVYFTLPMSLNYQRNSYTLWESVYKSWNDPTTKNIFSIESSATFSFEELQILLLKYKIALQPNKHTSSWKKISETIFEHWWSIEKLLEFCDYDFLKLQGTIQKDYKKWFPYLSGPKIFHYWCYILWEYCGIELKNKQYIEIAPDTHVLQCSVKLWVITQEESLIFTKDEISQIWRELLSGTELSPIDMHSPLWFWSRNNFQFMLKNV